MRLWPSSLFGRLALLLVGVLAIAVVTTILLFRQDRAALLLRHFGDTKIVQLRGLRDALDGLGNENRRESLARLGRRNGVRILAAEEREPPGFSSKGWRAGMGMPRGGGPEPGFARGAGPPGGAFMRDDEGPGDPRMGPFAAFVAALAQLEVRFGEALGPGIEMRVQPRAQALWVRLPASSGVYWVGFPLPPRPGADGEPSRALMMSVALALALLVAAFAFARYLARPLRELEGAVARVGRGESPQPLPESGPSEIAAVNRGFNTMLTSLRQTEHDRALLLAGVSHDLRTPLSRLRLGVELAKADAQTRAGMIADIEEMDRIIGQFLDFARGGEGVSAEVTDLNALARTVVQRYADRRSRRALCGG